MTRRVVYALMLALAWVAGSTITAVESRAQPPASATTSVTIPDTPAGRTLKAWLTSFNSGDRALMDAYYKKYQPDMSAEEELPFRAQTGGFDILAIQKSEALQITFMVKERTSETTARGRLAVFAGDPGVVSSWSLRAVPRGVASADFTIDAAERARAIEGAIASLNEFYVFPDIAKKMADAVRAKQKHGDYDAVTDGDAFAEMLTNDFRSVSHDRHLGVNFSAAKLPERQPNQNPNPGPSPQYRRQMERANCGFEKVEILTGNVGYLKFGFFADTAVCAPTATAAMNFLGNVDALIVDLRQNGGGSPPMVAYVSSYLFTDRTHLNDLWTRKENSTEEFWTRTDVPGKRMGNIPVYVLTSNRTFSGAEEFTYNLKSLKRATIVGETTGGGAHPVSGHRADEHFMIGVPFARAINPITKTNWEGVGVEPDVKVPAADALATAQKMIADKRGPKT
ncbi:MAG: S41 family peptidase [Gemmatimonadota bacterium]|nr:S41 family peptidase [Gemmatimonadota bacterium]